MRDRLQELHKLLPLVDGRPDAMIALARQLSGAGDREQAVDLAARALQLAPGDCESRTRAAEVLSDGIPSWHFMIVRDRIRNDAYEAALRRAITPESLVLEIGTGSGLLAMMAARAGARVVTCEANPTVAAAARDVIAANGLSDRITVVNKHSTGLDLDSDLGARADILVSEIVSNDLLSEAVLPAHEDAVSRLLKPGAIVIPARGSVRIALAEDRRATDPRVREVSGFDLSAFNRLARPYREIPVESPRLALRSDAVDLFDFDFASGGPWPDGRRDIALASSGGRVNGVAQWIALEMDETGIYENRPGTGTPSCWGCIFWPFVDPVETVFGQKINVFGHHSKDRIRIWRNSETQ